MTHICVGKLTIIGSDYGLSPGRHQAIIWTNSGILLIGRVGTNFSDILSAIKIFSFKKMHLKISSAKWRPFCLGLNVLILVNGIPTVTGACNEHTGLNITRRPQTSRFRDHGISVLTRYNSHSISQYSPVPPVPGRFPRIPRIPNIVSPVVLMSKEPPRAQEWPVYTVLCSLLGSDILKHPGRTPYNHWVLRKLDSPGNTTVYHMKNILDCIVLCLARVILWVPRWFMGHLY